MPRLIRPTISIRRVMGWSIARMVGFAELDFFMDSSGTSSSPADGLSRPRLAREMGSPRYLQANIVPSRPGVSFFVRPAVGGVEAGPSARRIDAGSAFLRDVDLRVLVEEADLEGPQVRMERGVLDRHQVRRRPLLVVVRVPEAGGHDEGRTRLPVGASAVDDIPPVVDLLADERVAAGLAVDDEVEGHRLVMVGELD